MYGNVPKNECRDPGIACLIAAIGIPDALGPCCDDPLIKKVLLDTCALCYACTFGVFLIGKTHGTSTLRDCRLRGL